MADRLSNLDLYDNHGEVIFTGSANAYVATLARSVSAYYRGLRVCGKANFTNTSAATLNLVTQNSPSGIGAVAIRLRDNSALAGGEIVNGGYYDFIYDDINSVFQLQSTSAGAPGSVSNAMLANMAQSTVKGRADGAGTGAPQDLTPAQARAVIDAVNIAGDTMTGPLLMQVGASTGANDFIVMVPTDFGAGKPYLTLYKGFTAAQWHIGLYDGVNSNGNIDFLSSGLSWNSRSLLPNVVQNVYVLNSSLAPSIPLDDTVPLSSEGTLILSQAITLASSASRVSARVAFWGAVTNTGETIIAALFRGSTCINVAAATPRAAGDSVCVTMDYVDSPGASGSTTYSVRVGSQAGGSPIRINGNNAARLFGGASNGTLTLTELIQ